MKPSHSIVWTAVAVIFATTATVLLLSLMVTNPANVIMELGGDCGKNYFTFLYHAVYDKGIWFQGMNYPYGEHIIYADGQPILSTFLNLFTHVSIHQALAVMNLAIGFSYVLAIVFTFKILSRFGVKPFIAILIACIINLMAPQVMRLRGHFALAYLCPIPMLFYWSLLYHQTHRWKYASWIFLMGLIMSFMHLYIGGIIFIWVAFYITGYLLFTKSPLRQKLTHLAPVATAAAALFICIKVFIALTDPVTDRPSFPLNSLESVTYLRDIYSSPVAPFWQLAKEKGSAGTISDNGEGYTYIGVASCIILVITFVLGIIKVIRKRKDHLIVSENKFSPVWLFVGIGSLLLAMGAPFIWHMEWLLNYLSLFKQFRAMGRFSWIFYYVITIFSAVVLYTWYARLLVRHRIIGYTMIVAFLAIWSVDVNGCIKYTHEYVNKSVETGDQLFYNNEKKWPEYLAEHNLKSSDFQAIIVLPFFITGSEKLWVGGDPSWPLSLGMRASMQLHLPIVDVMMSRTSWSITQKQVKAGAGPWVDMPILHDSKSDKPYLVLWLDGFSLPRDQEYLLQHSDSIGQNYQLHIYACYPQRLRDAWQKNVATINGILPYMQASDTCLVDKGAWYVNHFDNKKDERVLAGSGSAPLVPDKESDIVDIPVHPTEDQLYEFSCWFLLDNKDYRSPYVNIRSMDSSGNPIDSRDALTKDSYDNYGMWFRASRYFILKANSKSVKCVLMNNPNPTYLRMDELQLRPADATIISRFADGKIMVNNHLLTHPQ